MPDHTQRFTGRAEDYDRYRQRYPADAVLDRLRTWCGLTPTWRVADIGAGTGMLAEVFLANGNPVIAVEPNADMRHHMETRLAAHLYGRQVEVVDGTAEATTLANSSVDLIAAGRALHWFDRERATTEFRRILVPGGWVAVVALDRTRHSDDPRVKSQIVGFEELLANSGTDYNQVRGGYRTYEKMDEWFGGGEIHQTQIHGWRELDWEIFRGHTLSLSTAPRADSPGFPAFESAMRRYFDEHAQKGILTIPVTTARIAEL